MLLIISFKTKYQINRTSKHIIFKTMINKRCPRRTFTHITGSNRETGWLLNTPKNFVLEGINSQYFQNWQIRIYFMENKLIYQKQLSFTKGYVIICRGHAGVVRCPSAVTGPAGGCSWSVRSEPATSRL